MTFGDLGGAKIDQLTAHGGLGILEKQIKDQNNLWDFWRTGTEIFNPSLHVALGKSKNSGLVRIWHLWRLGNKIASFTLNAAFGKFAKKDVQPDPNVDLPLQNSKELSSWRWEFWAPKHFNMDQAWEFFGVCLGE